MEEENLLLGDIQSRGMSASPNPLIADIAARNSLSYESAFNYSGIVPVGGIGLGESRYDKPNIPFSQLYNLDEIRARRQPWLAKFGAGFGRVGTKAVSEIAKMPGVLGGIVGGAIGQAIDLATGEDNTDFVKTAFDNIWINSIADAEEHINEEVLPVYVRKAVQDGNLWDKITSIDFWATDGADGLGYIVAMLAPGQAISKLGLGSKLMPTKALTAMAKSTDDAAATLASLGIKPSNADIGLAAVANTIFESAAEAKGSMDSFEQSPKYQEELEERINKNYNEIIANAQGNPEIIQNAKILAQEKAEKEMQELKSGIGAKVFKSNVGILIGPNIAMSKILWGGRAARGARNQITKEGVEKVANPSTLKKIKNWGDEWGKGVLREGFWEEGLQSTAENYFTENPENTLGDFLTDAPKEWLKTLGTTDGQVAVFLGSVYGGTMSAAANSYKAKKDRETLNRLIERGNNSLNQLASIFQSSDVFETVINEQGEEEVVYVKNEETGELEKKVDPVKLRMKLEGDLKFEALSAIFDVAKETGDKRLLDAVKNKAYTEMVIPFILDDKLGVETLRQALDAHGKIAEATQGNNLDINEIKSDILNKATYLKNQYNLFQDFSRSLIKLNADNVKNKDFDIFYDKLLEQYLVSHSELQFLEKRKEKLTETITELGNNNRRFPDAANILLDPKNQSLIRDVLQSDPRLEKAYTEYLTLDPSIESKKDVIEDVWNQDKSNEAFQKFVNDSRELERKLEQAKKVQTVLDDIANSSNLDNRD